MSRIEDEYGLTPKNKCQVNCPVLKKLYETFRREEQSLWKQADDDSTWTEGEAAERSRASMRGRAAAYSVICTSLALVFNPEAMARMLDSMCPGGCDEDDSNDD